MDTVITETETKHRVCMLTLGLQKIIKHLLDNNDPCIDTIHDIARKSLKEYGGIDIKT